MATNNEKRPTRTPPAPKGPIQELFAPGAPLITTKAQLKQKFSSLDLFDVFLAVLFNHHSSADRIVQLETKVGELEDKLALQEERMSALEGDIQELKRTQSVAPPQTSDSDSQLADRVLRQEAYSGRNTIILAGLQDSDAETTEQLERKVVGLFQKADPTITSQDIGIVHRNGKKKTGPRSVTCVLTRASKKDGLMRKQSRQKIKAADKVGLYHRMSEGLRKRKSELEQLPNVDWVAFSGHRLFTVCVKNGDSSVYLKNILRASDMTKQTAADEN